MFAIWTILCIGLSLAISSRNNKILKEENADLKSENEVLLAKYTALNEKYSRMDEKMRLMQWADLFLILRATICGSTTIYGKYLKFI